MAYGIVNADTLVTSTSGGILGAGNASIMKNRIINGAMVIDQRNAGASVTPASGQYLVDRWRASLSQASKFSAQQNAGSVTPPVGFTNYLGMTSLSSYSVGATDYFAVVQSIEGFNVADLGWGTANAKTITLSFWAYSSLTGTFGASISNGAQNRFYPFSYSIPVANTWTQISVTIAGDTSGTWATNNTEGIRVYMAMGIGSTYSGTAGAWSGTTYFAPTGATSVVGTNGATFYITGVQLEVGSSATGFEYRIYTTELANCQRYFYRPALGFGGAVQGSTAITLLGGYPVAMRATPSVSVASALSVYQTGIGGVFSQSSASGGINASINSNTSYAIECGNFSGLTNAWPIAISAGTINISAEL